MGDLDQVLTQHVELQRDQATADAYGAETAPNWQSLATVRCRFWWWTQGYRGPAHEGVSPERTVSVGDGGLLVPLGTDVTALDRVADILDAQFNVVQAGPLEIVAVSAQETHIELYVRRP